MMKSCGSVQNLNIALKSVCIVLRTIYDKF